MLPITQPWNNSHLTSPSPPNPPRRNLSRRLAYTASLGIIATGIGFQMIEFLRSRSNTRYLDSPQQLSPSQSEITQIAFNISTTYIQRAVRNLHILNENNAANPTRILIQSIQNLTEATRELIDVQNEVAADSDANWIPEPHRTNIHIVMSLFVIAGGCYYLTRPCWELYEHYHHRHSHHELLTTLQAPFHGRPSPQDNLNQPSNANQVGTDLSPLVETVRELTLIHQELTRSQRESTAQMAILIGFLTEQNQNRGRFGSDSPFPLPNHRFQLMNSNHSTEISESINTNLEGAEHTPQAPNVQAQNLALALIMNANQPTLDSMVAPGRQEHPISFSQRRVQEG